MKLIHLKTQPITLLAISLLLSACSTNPSPNSNSSLPDTEYTKISSSPTEIQKESISSISTDIPNQPTDSTSDINQNLSSSEQSTSSITSPTQSLDSYSNITTKTICQKLITHIYCHSADIPPTPSSIIHAWGDIFNYAPEVFCASDVSSEVCSNVTSTLSAAILEWGNYGPVEYWVLGTEKKPTETLIEVFCQRRDKREQWPMIECIEHHSSSSGYGFEHYRKIGADAISLGKPSNEAARNGEKQWGLHLFTTSLPLGFTDHFDLPGYDDQKVIFHEYFHAIQASYLSTADSFGEGKRRDETEGPVWFVEGGAEFMALKATQNAFYTKTIDPVNPRGRALEEIGIILGREIMLWKMEDISRKLSEVCPDIPIQEIGYNCDGVSYDIGTWAHAYLANKFGSDTLLNTFYPILDELEWEEAFFQTYQMTSDQFLNGLVDFINLPIEQQTLILEMNISSTSTSKPNNTPEIIAPQSTNNIAITLTSNKNTCESLGTHIYCISSDIPPPPGPLPWGAISSYSPEVFCASDLTVELCGWVTSALLTAALEWGNYGPLEYWVLGIDTNSANTLTEVQCQRRTDRAQSNTQDCMQRHSPQGMHGFHSYLKLGADSVASGRPSGSAGLNGYRDMGFHFFTSSIPLGFTNYFEVAGAEEQKTVFHEYFHAIQHSYIFTEDRKQRDELLGPVWFNEGAAEYMAQVTTQKARQSGALEDINSAGRWPFEFKQNMRNFMNNGLQNIRNTCPGFSLKDLTYENSCNNATYDLGAWAHAYLANKHGSDILLNTFLPNVEKLGWEETFISSYGITSSEFYTEFDNFLQKPIEDQLNILP